MKIETRRKLILDDLQQHPNSSGGEVWARIAETHKLKRGFLISVFTNSGDIARDECVRHELRKMTAEGIVTARQRERSVLNEYSVRNGK